MDSYAVSETFLDDFFSALVRNNNTNPLRDEGEDLPNTLLEDLAWRPDIAIAAAEVIQTQPAASFEDFELPPELALTAIELNSQAVSMPLVSTPGFVALHATQAAAATSARPPRKPREKFTRENQIVLQGSNKTGREGKLRCETCRKRHSKCVFTSMDLPCLACLKDGISPCTKRWGRFKEAANGMTSGKVSEIGNGEDVEDFVLDPSRPPSTPIDAVIREDEVHLLQYLYDIEHNVEYYVEHRLNDKYFVRLFRVLVEVRSSYGVSINSPSIRSSLLSFANGLLFNTSRQGRYEQQLEEYIVFASRALVQKDHSLFGAEEFYTILFLTVSEDFRCCLRYRYSPRRRFNDVEALGRLGVHIKGMIAVLNHLKTGTRVAAVSVSDEALVFGQQTLVLTASRGNPVDLLDVASLYRRERYDILREGDAFVRAVFGDRCSILFSEFMSLVTGLLRIILEQVCEDGGNKDVYDAAMAEIKEYWCYWEKIKSIANSPSLDWCRVEECKIWFLCSMVLSCIKMESTISVRNDSADFIWADALVVSTIRLHDTMIEQVPADERSVFRKRLCSRIAIAALILPQAGNVAHCNSLMGFLAFCGFGTLAVAVERYWRMQDKFHCKKLVIEILSTDRNM